MRLCRPGEDKKVGDALQEDKLINHSIFILPTPKHSISISSQSFYALPHSKQQNVSLRPDQEQASTGLHQDQLHRLQWLHCHVNEINQQIKKNQKNQKKKHRRRLTDNLHSSLQFLEQFSRGISWQTLNSDFHHQFYKISRPFVQQVAISGFFCSNRLWGVMMV